MNVEQAKQLIRKHLLKAHLRKEENILKAEKLFLVNSAINWIFKFSKDYKVIQKYVVDLEKYLVYDIELQWLKNLNKESQTNDDHKKEAGEKSIATSGSR